MNYAFADRMMNLPESFLDRLFAVSSVPDIISFAGGLPNSRLIDVKGIKEAAIDVMTNEGEEALQYTTTDGYLPLRQYIADRYNKRLGLNATADEIRIVNGSQQCLDLVAKIFLNKGDHVGLEKPGYLGAIEAFSLYEPVFHGISLEDDGPVIEEFSSLVKDFSPKFFYGIPNFQNPSGRTYSTDKRRAIGEIVSGTDTVFYEDDAFGELAFDNKPIVPVKKFAGDNGIISGSFSKIIAPGMRIGWIYAPVKVIRTFDAAKQAADLHSNFLCQKIIHRYLETTDLDAHIKKITEVYQRHCRLMCELADEMLPDSVVRTDPKGGMFMLITLPEGMDSIKLFEEGLRQRVAVLPGVPFYTGKGGHDTIRLNFSAPDEENIKEGMERLAKAFLNM
ncbi:PLP-dependent aminotransferase family protein [Methanoplanus sp. FWC-SCC4]|uniref:PLP-dependent aminotransferase family protein n=1 Tax=Methanochimaera problematica TaxID=2609417 RepID=A0AA97I3I1_9EURY|nr:PLP-dependent aminotransferase family protein [Methanoplanus sp. FWC-SCC4]WOF16738.1 PLP-dependent aminotransferase family protein [Methanoplanus sp. FWC-SCC4]